MTDTTMTKTDKRVLNKARTFGREFTPTELGMKMGHVQHRASSKMAPHLKRLTEMGLLVRRQEAHNRVFYAPAD